jgi:ABC-type nitrate/sulfonate/bicarbonate transport system substrate-binding protein
MKMWQVRRRWVAVAIGAVVAVAGCGSAGSGGGSGSGVSADGSSGGSSPSASSVASTSADSTTESAAASGGDSAEPLKVTLRLDWLWGAEHTPYVLAKSLGYFADEGLDVQIDEGHGSNVTSTLVTTGKANFGVVSAGQVIVARSQDYKLQAVMNVLQHSPSGICYDTREMKLNSLKDLYGKTLGVVRASSAYNEWKAVQAINDLDASKIKEVDVGSSLVPAIVSGKVHVITGWSFNQCLQASVEGVPLASLSYKDYGLDSPNTTIVVNTDFEAEHPDAVRGFVSAVTKALKYVNDNPDEALSKFFEAQPKLKGEYNTKKLPMFMELVGDDPATFGTFNAEAWEQLQDIYVEQGVTDAPVQLDGGAYTTEFLPAGG